MPIIEETDSHGCPSRPPPRPPRISPRPRPPKVPAPRPPPSLCCACAGPLCSAVWCAMPPGTTGPGPPLPPPPLLLPAPPPPLLPPADDLGGSGEDCGTGGGSGDELPSLPPPAAPVSMLRPPLAAAGGGVEGAGAAAAPAPPPTPDVVKAPSLVGLGPEGGDEDMGWKNLCRCGSMNGVVSQSAWVNTRGGSGSMAFLRRPVRARHSVVERGAGAQQRLGRGRHQSLRPPAAPWSCARRRYGRVKRPRTHPPTPNAAAAPAPDTTPLHCSPKALGRGGLKENDAADGPLARGTSSARGRPPSQTRPR